MVSACPGRMLLAEPIVAAAFAFGRRFSERCKLESSP
jgi:hypothetical protein